MYAHFLKPCYSLAYLEASNIRNLMFKQSKCEYIAKVILLSTRGTAGSDIWYSTRTIVRWCEATIRGIMPERL